MRMASKRPEIKDTRGGEYPTERYSEEETERLLAMAYAAIPPRAGRRGTRNLQRQKRRQFQIQKGRDKAKQQRIQAHFRKMEKRSLEHKKMRAFYLTEAPAQRAKDRKYQLKVLQRWVKNLEENDDDIMKQEIIQAEATVINREAKAEA